MNCSTLAIYFKIKAEWFNCSVKYSTSILWYFHRFPSLVFFSFFLGFPYKGFQTLGNWYIVFYEMEMWLWSSLLPFFQFYSVYLGWADQILKIYVNYAFTRLRGFSVLFSVRLLVIPNFAFALWTAIVYGQEKPHNRYAVPPMPDCNHSDTKKMLPKSLKAWLHLAYLSLCNLLWAKLKHGWDKMWQVS